MISDKEELYKYNICEHVLEKEICQKIQKEIVEKYDF